MDALSKGLAGSLLAMAAVMGSSAAQAAGTPTAILVHGAFADGSSWNQVISRLNKAGIPVIAVQNPLSSLADDVAATQRAIDRVDGDVVLVGHSWAGTVITQAGLDPKVKGLVYVAAFAPEPGQSTAALGKNYPVPPGIGKLAATKDGYLYLPAAVVKSDFAQDVPPAEAQLIAATQGLIRGAAFDEPVTQAAWQTRPSWFVVSTHDHMIDPGQQLDMAKRIGAHVTKLQSSHVSMVSHPDAVAQVIGDAVKAVQKP
ncbi:alpha/beta fold hydrolase [Bordetella genomosp. 4]|uniref:AB hydrolase-1 domain-containing protein n=1 Tax=Bordetella genomosp. 4 TaxID=463044 RepID=A0A261U1X3_9BORD|nr:alpha/beta hydrolase [Bordetella genomosp. 4]OZI49515.1 hypothetical protein CAL21_08050 [Bordetella genomosp. 4]OZI55956.1 hypothetical protein CAL20_10885 [Bordetella genomosp. 4]